MMKFEWVGWDRHFFIATRVYLEEVEAVSIQIWIQVAAYVNADAHIV